MNVCSAAFFASLLAQAQAQAEKTDNLCDKLVSVTTVPSVHSRCEAAVNGQWASKEPYWRCVRMRPTERGLCQESPTSRAICLLAPSFLLPRVAFAERLNTRMGSRNLSTASEPSLGSCRTVELAVLGSITRRVFCQRTAMSISYLFAPSTRSCLVVPAPPLAISPSSLSSLPSVAATVFRCLINHLRVEKAALQ